MTGEQRQQLIIGQLLIVTVDDECATVSRVIAFERRICWT